MPSTFTPTKKRGPELAREVLDIIEFEEERVQADTDRWVSVDDLVKDQVVWVQSTWGEIFLDKLPPGVDVEVVPPEAATDFFGYPRDMVSISGGLSCGTAMCFAGHVVNLVGDRPVISMDPLYTQNLRRGKKRKNLRRWLNKLSGNRISTQENISQVFTPEGKVEPVKDRARKLLGLTEAEADAMFSGANTLPQLRRYVQRMEENRHVGNGKKKRLRR